MPYSCHQCQTLLTTGSDHCPGCGLVFPGLVPEELALTNPVSQLPSSLPVNSGQRSSPITVSKPSGIKIYGKGIVGLDRLLAPGEKIMYITGGLMKTHIAGSDTVKNAVCAATDRRCIFYNRRMWGRYDFEDFPYDRITSIQVRKGLAWGAIDIYVAQVKKELYLTDNNCVENLGNFVREKIHYRVPLTEVSPVFVETLAPPTSIDVPAQIRELAQLLQEGHLTQQEFDDMKRDLLNKLRYS
jgi:hypothetical protein